ncbi:iron-sulfur cluster assembly accessory protein [Roseibium sp. RKSG952]|uniref:HesB/IscA family protein n=1 Tax=Roseibium sp. RKSG952 TaxID=2529384 RepID=UPI0012BC0AA0|nr:iron-sulfur cluster assembly accessory protein [Roseibium sp. RKSG952]MTH95999.1 iron-sulfur cluster assembly accessory protein [Roseibium sp. RKSG952]
MLPAIIDLTEAAAERIGKLSAEGGGKIVRLSVPNSGCSGLSYKLDYADAPGPHDERIEAGKGAALYVDPLAIVFVAGMTIDWAEEKFSRGFVFKNPNEAGRCGCGESFSVA